MPRAAKATLPVSSSTAWLRRSRRDRPARTNPAARSKPTLLWIDDFAPALTVYKATMETLGFRVLTANNGGDGLRLAALHPVDLVITDYEMPGMNGETVAAGVKALKPALPVIVFSGSTTVSQRLRRYADAFCDKAGSRDRLLGAIHRLLHRKHPGAQQTPTPLRASDLERRTVA